MATSIPVAFETNGIGYLGFLIAFPGAVCTRENHAGGFSQSRA